MNTLQSNFPLYTPQPKETKNYIDLISESPSETLKLHLEFLHSDSKLTSAVHNAGLTAEFPLLHSDKRPLETPSKKCPLLKNNSTLDNLHGSTKCHKQTKNNHFSNGLNNSRNSPSKQFPTLRLGRANSKCCCSAELQKHPSRSVADICTT